LDSDQVRKALFHPPELTNTKPQEKDRDNSAQGQTGEIEPALSAQDAPAKSVDHADHRVEGIEQAPLLRYHARAETDRRDVQAELHDERNDVLKVAIPHVESGDPEGGPDADEKGKHDERGQE
jgi:hypothetical protein